MPPKTPKTEPVAAVETPVAAAPAEPTPAPVADKGRLVHVPCGNAYEPSEEGLAWALANRKYHCARCGGAQPGATFAWSNGQPLL